MIHTDNRILKRDYKLSNHNLNTCPQLVGSGKYRHLLFVNAPLTSSIKLGDFSYLWRIPLCLMNGIKINDNVTHYCQESFRFCRTNLYGQASFQAISVYLSGQLRPLMAVASACRVVRFAVHINGVVSSKHMFWLQKDFLWGFVSPTQSVGERTDIFNIKFKVIVKFEQIYSKE